MAFSLSASDISWLRFLAARTRITCRIVCGRQAQITNAITNLYGVLRRLQQEASRAQSALNRSDATGREDLNMQCILILNDTNDFLLAHKTLRNYEARIVGLWEFASSTNRQQAVMDHFRSEAEDYAYRFSQILITASLDSLGGLEEQLDSTTGQALGAVLNDLTSILVANGDIRLSILMKGSENEEILWEALNEQLSNRGLENSFLERHKNIILRYVRALERRSAFGDSVEAPLEDGKGEASVKMETEDSEASKLHYYAKRKSDSSDGEEGRKRARSDVDQSLKPPRDGETNSDRPSTSHEDKGFFGFPHFPNGLWPSY